MNDCPFPMREDLLDVDIPQKISKEGYLNLKSNELLTVPQHELLGSLASLSREDLFRYPTYHEAMSAFVHYLGVDVSEIQLTAGSDDAIRLLLGGSIFLPTTVCIEWPNYQNYQRYLSFGKMNVTLVPIAYEYGHSLDSLVETCQRVQANIAIVARPNGFTGQAYNEEEIRRLCTMLAQQECILLIDEAYADLEITSVCPLVKEYTNLICIKSLSKSLGLAGLRLGVIVSNASIMRRVKQWFSETSLAHPSLSVACTLLNNPDYHHKLQASHTHHKQSMISLLTRHTPWRIFPTKTNFLLMDLLDEKLPPLLFAHCVQHGIYLADISIFRQFERCIRMTVCPENDQHRVKETICAFIDQP